MVLDLRLVLIFLLYKSRNRSNICENWFDYEFDFHFDSNLVFGFYLDLYVQAYVESRFF